MKIGTKHIEVNNMKTKIAPCMKCGKETYNQTSFWSGYCSRKCEKKK